MPSSAVLDADASRLPSGILTPSSEGSLNRQDASISSESRKRKRADSVALEHLLMPSIAIKPHPPNLQVRPRILQPMMLLPRKHLTLSSIDFNAGTSDFSGRFVEAHIKILDLESRVGSTSSVLIARYDPKGSLFALERHETQQGLYMICQLGDWVDLQSLKNHALAVAHERMQPIKLETIEQSIPSATTTPQLHTQQKKKQAAIEAIQSLVKKRARSESVSLFNELPKLDSMVDHKESRTTLPSPEESIINQSNTSNAHRQQESISVVNPDHLSEAPQQTADAIFDNIRTQYFEALYKSMGSLAYFAKGPLSRARSAFHLDLEANLDMADLVEFLKSLVLTTVQIDQKYRQAVPDVIEKLKMHVESSDEGRKRRRKPKKMKLGKDGLYPTEDEHIRAWWTANQPEVKDGEVDNTAALIRSHASLLRTRETQLQMILILEILALGPLKAAEGTPEATLPTLPGLEESRETPVTAPSKRRNKHNLPVLLEVHADRLTIWQSIATDEQLILEDSQAPSQSFDSQTRQKASSEPLKDFCVDVIVPFFSARLPAVCDSINRKLGGPVIAASSKSKSRSRQFGKREQKPGAAAKRPPLPNAPRTLQRALSTEQQHRRSVSRGPSNMIALMRSATSTTIPSFKREGSESVMARTTVNGEQAESQPRDVQKSSFTASLEDAKAKKKAMVEAELKDAISALRKPNRDVVGKALAEAAAHRVTTSLSAKKGKKSVRSASSMIQVKATPTNKRFKDMLGITAAAVTNSPLIGSEEIIPPSSIGTLVPSTSRRNQWNATHRSTSPSGEAIESTPMKPLKYSSISQHTVGVESAIPMSSPAMDRTWASPHNHNRTEPVSPVAPLRRLDFSASRSFVIQESLVESSVLGQDPPKNSAPKEAKEGGLSIYQQLGWDDDLDDLL